MTGKFTFPPALFQSYKQVFSAARYDRGSGKAVSSAFPKGKKNTTTSGFLLQIEPSSTGAHLPPSDDSSIQQRAGWCFLTHFGVNRRHYLGTYQAYPVRQHPELKG